MRVRDGTLLHVHWKPGKLAIEADGATTAIDPTPGTRIVPGVWYGDEVTRELAHAIKALGADAFNEREAAMKRVLEFGTMALTGLKKASRSGDPIIAATNVRCMVPS